jgi:drug/metabolite transporter (DMT)-like permease
MNSRSTANVLADALSRPDAALALAALFWSGNFVAGRALADQIDPVSLNFWRWALALAVLLPVSWRALAASGAALRTSWRRIALLGLTGVAGFHTCVYFALTSTTATSALLLVSLAPVAIVIATWIAYREAPRTGEVVGILVSLAGAGVLVTKGSLDALLGLRLDLGVLWMLAGLAIWAAYSVLLKVRIAGVQPLALHTATVIAGLAWMLPAYGIQVAAGATAALTWTGALGIAYIAVFASAIAFFFWIRGIEQLGPNRAGMFIHLMPVFGAILAALFLGERIAMFHVAGAALVFAGLALGNRR